jgi:hypothetical protein
MMHWLRALVAVTTLSSVGACVDPGPPPTASGDLKPGVGKQAPSTAKVVVLWSGSDGYPHKFGEGTSTRTAFHVNVPPTLPTEALRGGGVGIGLLFLMKEDVQIADGKQEPSAVLGSAIGAAGDYALIYIEEGTDSQPGFSWKKNFPVGISCGKGVQTSELFDAFTPVPCDSLRITVDDLDKIHFVNWT